MSGLIEKTCRAPTALVPLVQPGSCCLMVQCQTSFNSADWFQSFRRNSTLVHVGLERSEFNVVSVGNFSKDNVNGSVKRRFQCVRPYDSFTH